ncbi:MAG: hypothetical protein WDM92_01925 [Caulobacteraceae bacterium]
MGQTSLAAMSDGTFQGGFSKADSMMVCSIGVRQVGWPTTVRMDRTGWSPSNSSSWAAAMFTSTRSAGSGRGSQRQRSRLASICRTRSSAGTFSAAMVAAPAAPSGVMP